VFTGIIESLGAVARLDGPTLSIAPQDRSWADDLKIGESIAINGACLTAIEGSTPDHLIFDVSPETFARTSLGDLALGSLVNLERAMRLNERIGGHIVLGHVDANGTIASRTDHDAFSEFTVQAPAAYDRYLIDKGSIAIDGISLTVVQPTAGLFSLWIIPATLRHTTLQYRNPGDRVNLEFDVLAKHVEKLLSKTPQD
jgi:riboflavin synthase